MIGSHNTFTFLSPKHKFFNLFKWLWRCQDKTIDEQYKAGVKYFDIRVSSGYKFAHGLVTLDTDYMLLGYILTYIKNTFPNAKCRIILERGNTKETATFVTHVINLLASKYFYPILEQYVHQIIVKKDWKIIYDNPKMNLEIKDYSYVPRYSDKSFWYNLTHFKFDTIKHHSKSNPTITKEMIEDKNVVYFMDYIK